MSKSPKNYKFSKPLGGKTLRKTFIIMTEGSKTEPQYFKLFNLFKSPSLEVRVKRNKSDLRSAPKHVLKRMEQYLRDNPLEPGDEAWVVVDRNGRSKQEFAPPAAWTKQHKNHHLAISNPRFEYWLLLHFEDGNDIGSAQDCDRRLRRKGRLPDYRKGINVRQFPPERIREAARRARRRDRPPCGDWPCALGITTVYRLVEKLLRVIDSPAPHGPARRRAFQSPQ